MDRSPAIPIIARPELLDRMVDYLFDLLERYDRRRKPVDRKSVV